MKRTTILFIGLLAIVSPAAPASAQVEAGLSELALTGSFDRGNQEFVSRTTRIEVDGRYGFFATNRFSFGPEFSYFKQEELEDAEWAVSGFVHMHLGHASNRLKPYLSGAYGQFFGTSGGDSPTFVSGGAGVKLFAGEGGALDISAFYRRVFIDYGGVRNFPTGRNEIGVKVGVAVYFGG